MKFAWLVFWWWFVIREGDHLRGKALASSVAYDSSNGVIEAGCVCPLESKAIVVGRCNISGGVWHPVPVWV